MDLIDRQEALEGLYDVFFDDDLSAAYPKEADKVLDVIRKLPSASYQQVTGKLDCVSRQQAIKAFDDAGFCTHGYIVDTLKDLPSAQPEIIRCNDCKWCEDTDGLTCKNPASWVVATDCDFGCVLAERKEYE